MITGNNQRHDQTLVGGTGTNGKTPVGEFTRQLLAATGRQAASLGTLGLTTPDGRTSDPPLSVGREALPVLLDDLAVRGVDTIAFEGYSTALDRGTLDALSVDVAAFTNIGRDHLDYHGGKAAYVSANARLFETALSADGVGVETRTTGTAIGSAPSVTSAGSTGPRTVGRATRLSD